METEILYPSEPTSTPIEEDVMGHLSHEELYNTTDKLRLAFYDEFMIVSSYQFLLAMIIVLDLQERTFETLSNVTKKEIRKKLEILRADSLLPHNKDHPGTVFNAISTDMN